MNTATGKSSGFGAWLCTRWARFYTRRLPVDIQAARRDEIASDVWEHAHDVHESNESGVRLSIAVIGRVLSGIPADLSWRREARRSRQRVATGGTVMPTRLSSFADRSVIYLAAAGAAVAATLLPILGNPDGDYSAPKVVWLLLAGLLGTSLVVGIVVRERHPTASTALLVVGSLAPSLAWYWLPPVYLLTIAITAAALLSARRRQRTAPANV